MPHQHWNPDDYARHAGFVAVNGESLIDMMSPRPGERVLDLGCGDGRLTVKLVEAGCEVVGVDASVAQVEAAQKLGLDARVVDACRLTFDQEFDAVFSNAVLHWIKDQNAVLKSVYRSLKPGGRFIGEMGGEGNVATVREAIHAELQDRGIDPWALDPWYFPSIEEYRRLLESAGFEVRDIERFSRPTRLLTDIEGWLATFAGPFVEPVPPQEHAAFFAAVQRRTESSMRRPDGNWELNDYLRLRFAAIKPA